jgi:molecular chaperone DnaK (HSP70)
MIVGIDLGTCNCCISYIKDNQLHIIKDNNKYFIPSKVYIHDDNILIGNEINDLHSYNNINIFHNFKRLVGHTLHDIYTTNLVKILNYKIIEDNNKIKLCTNTQEYYIEEIFVLLLKYIKNLIINNIGVDWKCIVTIPANFNQNQRQIIWNSILIADLPCIKLLNEPTSAFLSYYFDINDSFIEPKIINDVKKALIIDFGAGTLDLTIVEMSYQEEFICEVLGIYGDNNFGGIDITNAIYQYIFNENELPLDRKLKIAEEIKILLSEQNDVIYNNEIDINITQKEYINILKKLEHNIILAIDNILMITGLEKYELDNVILVGGSCKIPYFINLIKEYFANTKIKIENRKLKIDKQIFLCYKDIAVSIGAALYGYHNKISKNLILIERLPLSIGVETINNEIIKIIDRNTIIPITKSKYFTTENENEKSININIYQGESIFKENCILIGSLILSNIPKGSKPVIIVTIQVDNNNIIEILAHDKKHFTESKLIIEKSNTLINDELINVLINKYKDNYIHEKNYKCVLDHYYNIITFLDKISYQLNFNITLHLDEEIRLAIIEDFKRIIYFINNTHIICKYNLNTNIIKKIIVLNNISYLENNDVIDIDFFIDKLKNLFHLLKEKYDILFLINDSIESNNNNEYYDFSNNEDSEKTNLCDL